MQNPKPQRLVLQIESAIEKQQARNPERWQKRDREVIREELQRDAEEEEDDDSCDRIASGFSTFSIVLNPSQAKKIERPSREEAIRRYPVDLTPKSYSKSEVAEHNKRDDCWIIIKDKVYDVTSYVEEHPGGDAILDHAGDDSTDGFFGPQSRISTSDNFARFKLRVSF
ncbi:cytochrome B5-like protein [Brassica napus]|uniref:cytochrome B5-like protein n=1 Tax=Brassica napus TaxID=3708 RepID=UPI0004F162F2|nr:cytochrome B5-like protein [Brassica napus]